MSENLMSVDEAASDLGVSRATMWNWIRRHELRTFRRIGDRRTFLERAEVERLREPVLIDPAKKAVA